MNFHYIAAQSNGKMVEGDIEAQDQAAALTALAARGLRPVSLQGIKGFKEVKIRGIFSQAITVTDKVFLTKYLSLMLNVGTDLFRAIDILIADFDKPAVRALLIEIRAALEKGQPFYATFARYPKYFSPVFVNLVKAGEASGNLEQVFQELSVNLQKEDDLRQKIKSAITYPVILMIASVAMLVFLVTFSLPKIANAFLSNAVQPPLFSRIVFAVGLFLNKYILLILALLTILGVIGWFIFTKTIVGKRMISRFFNSLPVVNDTLKKIALQRFASTLGSLLKSGLPITESLEITADAVGNTELKDSLVRISREGISKGLSIGESFRRETVFPRVVANLMAISEKAGHIENILEALSNFYETEIETSIKIFISFLEPTLLLIIGVIIGTIALAIIVPIYQLIGQF